MGHYIRIPTSHVSLLIGVGIYAATTADAVATGKVKCYNFFHSLPQFVEMISDIVVQCFMKKYFTGILLKYLGFGGSGLNPCH